MTVSDRVLETRQFLQQVAIFRDLSEEQLTALANIAIPQSYKRGATLFMEGDPGTGFFIVKTGKIKVFKLAGNGKEQILHVFAAEEYFAEVPAFDGGVFPASAAAIEAAEVLFIPRSAFLLVLEQHPTMALAMLSTFARHLRRLAHLVDTLSFQDVPQRLATYLLGLSSRHGNADVVQLDLPKGQLAALLGTIPETLSRTFYKLSQDGMIAVNGTTVQLCDRRRLESLQQKPLG